MDNSLDIKWIHLAETLNSMADYFIELARQNLTEDNSIATGELYNSFEKIIEIGEDYFKVSVSMADYWKYVNGGRSPGKFPPPDAIRNWIEVKPVNPYPLSNGKIPSVEQLTFLISRKIANDGIEPTDFYDKAKEEAIRRFEKAIDEAIGEDVMDFINELVEKEMKKAFGGK